MAVHKLWRKGFICGKYRKTGSIVRRCTTKFTAKAGQKQGLKDERVCRDRNPKREAQLIAKF